MGSDEDAARKGVLTGLLAAHPTARISAITPDGVPTDVPDGLGLSPTHLVSPTAGIVGYVPADRTAVIAAFDQARQVGVGRARARLVEAPDVVVDVHLIDTVAQSGVVLAITVVSEESEDVASVPYSLTVAGPRLARVRKSKTATILEIDEATTLLLGWESHEMVGQRSLDFIHPDDQALAIESWFQLWSGSGRSAGVRLRYRSKSGGWVWFETSHLDLTTDEAHPNVLAEMVDISAEMAAQEALQARERLLRQLTQTLPLGVFQTDLHGRLVYTNTRFHEITGSEPSADGDSLARLAGEDRPKALSAFRTCLQEGQEHTLEFCLHLEDGSSRHCEVTLRPLLDESGQIAGAVGCVSDTTENVAMRRQLERQATTDGLTGCLNRTATLAALVSALAGDGRKGTAVVYVDLNGFKEVNDQLGHGAGDAVLRMAASALRDIDPTTIVGRMGGDEFLAVCPNSTEADAQALAERIASALQLTLPLPEGSARITASVGVAWTDQPQDADQLIARADHQMYEAKRQSRISAMGGVPIPRASVAWAADSAR
jgi:diguanylate cyclase (GGDEF)-like protein/PAS domain S-box-containing protein